jgi:hypothetical protein
VPLVTKELLEQKLTKWTLSSQVHKVLGFTDEQELEVKTELNTLASLGVVDKDGAKRGLKYRLAGIVDSEGSEEELDEEDSEKLVEEDRSVRNYKVVRQSNVVATEKANFYELLEWITNVDVNRDPYLNSMALVVKKLSDGSIDVITYAGIMKLRDTNYSPDEFSKFIHKSITPKNTKETK